MAKPRLLSEPEAWRVIAASERPDLLYFALLCLEPAMTPEAYDSASSRLRAYDSAAWGYGPGDEFANMDEADGVLAALWLAMEAEDELPVVSATALRVASLAGSQ